MGACKELLKDFEYYCMVENGFEIKKNSNRKQYNFQRIMNEIQAKKQDENVASRYNDNINQAKEIAQKLTIVHNTSLDSIISIIQNGGLLSIEEMEKKDISFNFRVSFRGIDEQMHKYIFASTYGSDPIYGLYSIKLKSSAENIGEVSFIPKSHIQYGTEVLMDYFMDIKNIRTYLAEEIAIGNGEPGSYVERTPVHLRPEVLFTSQVPITYFEEIACSDEKMYSELVRRIKKEFGENNEILNIIKIVNQ